MFRYVFNGLSRGSKKFTAIIAAGFITTLLATCIPFTAIADGNETDFELISYSLDNESAASTDASTLSFSIMSHDGRYVAFRSMSDDIVPGDYNNAADIFVRDRVTGTTERVSVSSSGVEANRSCGAPSMSADGRYIAFSSYANNLVSGDTNGNSSDVFVHDRLTHTTTRVSVGTGGIQGTNMSGSDAPSISADGRYVSFRTGYGGFPSPYNGNKFGYRAYNIFVHDRLTNATELASVSTEGALSNRDAETSIISADGRYVLFSSRAYNLAPGATSAYNSINIYLRDMVNKTTELMPAGIGNPIPVSLPTGISADGRFVSWYTNKGPGPSHGAFIYDRETGNLKNFYDAWYPVMSSDGRYCSFWTIDGGADWADSGCLLNLYDREYDTETTIFDSADYAHLVEDLHISGDGATLAFSSHYPFITADTNYATDMYVVTGYLEDEVPDCPENAALEQTYNEGFHAVTISWSAPSDGPTPAGYRVYKDGAVVCDVPHEDNTAIYSCNEAGLADCSEYCYTVIAYNSSGGESEDCSSACVVTSDETAPSVPANVDANALSGSEIALTWDVSNDNCEGSASNYYIYDCDGNYIGSTDTTGYVAGGLEDCTEYCFRVSAVDATGNESAQGGPATARTLDVTPPECPAGFTATAVSGTEIALSWDAAADECEGSAAGYTVTMPDGSTVDTAGTSLTVTGLLECHEYCYSIASYDSSGNSSGACATACAKTPWVIEGKSDEKHCGGIHNIGSAIPVKFTITDEGMGLGPDELGGLTPVLYKVEDGGGLTLVDISVVGSQDGLFKYQGGGVWMINIKTDALEPGEYVLSAEPVPNDGSGCSYIVIDPAPYCDFILVEPGGRGKGK